MWRMPLYRPYRRLLDSKVADINNVSAGGFGGAITAALYLQEFVPDDVPWAHFDMMAWNNATRPGRPEGGEAQAARAIFATIEKRMGEAMTYTLEQLSADIKAALKADPGKGGKEAVCKLVSKVCLDKEFIARHLTPRELQAAQGALRGSRASASASAATST